ncbi:MAG: ATP-binding SpoIIE family protein phosphatase [Adhaeribacter sp.]
MAFNSHISFPLTDSSFKNVVKRDITRLAEAAGFSEGEVGKVNIIVSEMVSNLFKHKALEGELLVKTLDPDQAGLEIIYLDKGPGMADVRRMVEDGVSTAGTSGQGLGAIKRLSDEFDIYSQKGEGTVILSRLFKSRHKPKKAARQQFEVGAVMVPKPGETHCGDGWAVRLAIDKCQLLVADGLGHGEFAEQASQAAVQVFLSRPQLDPAEGIRHIHSNIKKTRGAVANLVTIGLAEQKLSYCGVGNIAGRVLTGPDISKSVISYNGILGHNIPNTLHNHQVGWTSQSLLILHSDGIKSKWDLLRFKDLARHQASVIAALVYKQFNRGTDDTLVLVVRSFN